MKKTTKIFFLIALSAIVLHACTATLKVPTDSDYQRGKQKYSDLTLADFQDGAHTYTAKCAQCHSLKKPQDFTEEQWNKIFPVMARKAKLTDKENTNTFRYVMTMREAGSKK